MSTPASPRRAGAALSSQHDQKPVSVSAPRPAPDKADDDPADAAPGLDLTDDGSEGIMVSRSSFFTFDEPLQDTGEDADDHAMTQDQGSETSREAGVSFPMTTTAQVELRDAIRARTQQRLEDLRARTSA